MGPHARLQRRIHILGFGAGRSGRKLAGVRRRVWRADRVLALGSVAGPTENSMTKDQIKAVLAKHLSWLKNPSEGEGADLRGADLRDADLRGAHLRDADLRDADLRGADLCGAHLRDADLRGANLCGAHLRDADLRDADLCGADLCGADLCDAHLRDAD